MGKHRVRVASLVLVLVASGCGVLGGAPPRAARPRATSTVASAPATSRAPGASSTPDASSAPVAAAPDAFAGPGDRCDPASDLEAVEAAILGAPATGPAPASGARSGAPAARWDHSRTPRYLDAVERRFGLTAEERRHLFADGVVVPDRLAYTSYGHAFGDVHRSQLPVYVSVDAVLHAVYASHDKVTAWLEATVLSPALTAILDAMQASLAASRAAYAAETARDAEVYLAVARALLSEEEEEAKIADAEVRNLVASVRAASGWAKTTLFGRERMIDLGAFRPRGHYAPGAASKNPMGRDLSPWFRAAMWLSRIEMNLVSRSSQSSSPVHDPRETPRDAALALALADLATRAGVEADIAKIDGAWTMLAGAREDVSFAELRALSATAGIQDVAAPDAPARLRAAIGGGYVRTARTHYQREPSPELPVIATMLGPRITPDATATRALVHPVVPGRSQLPALEMAYALGHDRALAHLSRDVAAFPGLGPGLRIARDVVFGRSTWEGAPLAPSAAPRGGGADLYSAWMTAIRGLAETPEGTLPSFSSTTAFADMRVASAVAAYAQIRHDYVLLVPTTYDEAGCEIPDGWVEPAPATYAALVTYADRGALALRPYGEDEAAYFLRLGRVLRVLARIAERELAGEPLRDEDKRFLAMVAEQVKGSVRSYDASPRWDGWYYTMHHAVEDSLEDAALVADFFASTNTGRVEHAGVKGPRMGIFVVDVGGEPRVAVGPVTSAFQAASADGARWSDDDVSRIPASAPWAASYLVKGPATPPFTLRTIVREAREGIELEAVSSADVGPVTVALLDHHRAPVVSQTKTLRGSPSSPARVRLLFERYDVPDGPAAQLGIEGIHVTRGDFHFVDGTLHTWELESKALEWRFPQTSSRPVYADGDDMTRMLGHRSGRGRRR